MYIKAYNIDLTEAEKTYVSVSIPRGQTTIKVKDNQNFLSGQRILVSAMGLENSELVTVATVADDKLSIAITSATKFAHNADDDVYILDFDQIRFYRAPSINTSYTLMQTLDMDVDNADEITRWDDPNAVSGYYYKTTFYNSFTTEESSFSDPVQATGYQDLAIGRVIDGSVRRVRDTSFSVLSIDDYLDIADEVGQDLITQAHRPYRFLKRTVILDGVAGQNYVDLPSIWKFNHVFLLTVLGGTFRYNEVKPIEADEFYDRYDNSDYMPQDNTQVVAVDEELNRLLIYPTPRNNIPAIVKVKYYKKFDKLKDVGSLIETPNGLIYRYKFMAEYYSARAESDRQWLELATKYENKYGNEIMKMQRVNRLDTGTPRSLVSSRYRKRRRYTLR